MRYRIGNRKPIERLTENITILEDLIEYPERFGAFILLKRLKNNESKPPTNIDLLKFKLSMEKEIRVISKKVERWLGFELPSGLK